MKKMLMTIGAAVVILGARHVAFAEDAYVESTGVAGMDTGYHLKPTTRVELDFQLTDMTQTDQSRVFGADYNNSELKMSCCIYISGVYLVYGVGNSSEWRSLWMKDSGGNYIQHDTNRHLAVFDFLGGIHRYETAGSVTATYTDPIKGRYTDESTRPLAIFSTMNATGFNRPATVRIYGMKIYENDELVHDFVPCVRDGTVGFKDVQGSGGFICNPAAETSFTYGGDVLVENSPYVATPEGNQDASKQLYLDTHYYASVNTRLELDYALTDTRTDGTWYLFSGETRYCAYLNARGVGFCLAGNLWVSEIGSAVANLAGVRRTIYLDGSKNECGMITAGYTNGCSTATTNALYSHSRSVKLAAYCDPGNYFASMKIYGCRIYESGTLVRDFRPCVIGNAQDDTVIVGLKDELTGIFAAYPGEMTESRHLAHGGVLQASPPYVETLRADMRYIDTGYLVNPATKVELDYAPAGTRVTGDTWYLFSAAGSATYTAFINNGGFGYNNGSWKMNAGMSSEASYVGIRRTVILDNPAKVGVVITGGETNLITNVDDPSGKDYASRTLKISTPHGTDAHFATIRVYGCKIWEKVGNEYVLQHDYVPAVVNGTAGLQDIWSNGGFKPGTGTTPLAYGGAFPITVTPSATNVVQGRYVTLTAFAPGATSYRWLRNGVPLKDDRGENVGTTGMLTLKGRRPMDNAIDTYQAIARFTGDGLVSESVASEAVTVENVPNGTVVLIK